MTLGAYHFIFKFGNYKPEVHKLGFLGTRIVGKFLFGGISLFYLLCFA